MRIYAGTALIVAGVLLWLLGAGVFAAAGPPAPLLEAIGTLGLFAWWMCVLAGVIVLRGRFGADLALGCLTLFLFFVSVNLAFQAYDRPTGGNVGWAVAAFVSLIVSTTGLVRSLPKRARFD
jgi:hypothetical protein